MNCVSKIEQQIDTVYSTSNTTMMSFEQEVDSYLDAVLEYQGWINILREMTDLLTESLYRYSNLMTVDEYITLKPKLKEARSRLTKIYMMFRKNNDFYAASKACVNEFHYSIDNLKEVCSDLQMFKVDLPQDDEFESLVASINAM